MINKFKALPEKRSFIIGMSMILGIGPLLFLLSLFVPMNDSTMIILAGVVSGFAILFILNAADKKHASGD